MKTPFDQKIRELESATSYHEFAYTPQESVEELAQIARSFHIVLSLIAYPDNWPRPTTLDETKTEAQTLVNWMQSVAANMLTNYDVPVVPPVRPDGPETARGGLIGQGDY